MSLPELGIRRYVMAFMFAWGIIIFGIVSYFMTGVDQYPDVDFPFIMVTTTQSGADAEVVDITITKELLEKLNGISGIDSISGTSRPGVSIISIAFALEKDVDVAFNEVQAKISEAMSFLPSDIDTPIARKSASGGEAVIRVTLTGNRTLEQLNSYAENFVKKRLESINGVSEAVVYGARDRQLRVELDVYKMASFGLSVNDVISAINRSHYQLPGGYIVGDRNELLLKLDLEFHDVEGFKKLIVKKNGSSFVRLSDIADVYEGLEDFRRYSAFNSLPSLTIAVSKISGANVFAIEEDARNRLEKEILPTLEPGLALEQTSSSIDFIKAMVLALEEHLIVGTILTSIVVYLFLRSFISTIIVSFAIPVSLFGAVIVIYAFGYTFNGITLLGLLLLIGVVVDDAIIVLENIYRKMEEGVEPEKAAIEGSNQIIFAVLAATLSLVSIFGPVIFMAGIVGKFFQSFSVVVVFGVLISYIVSLYVTPMLCARYLRVSHKEEGRFKKSLEAMFVALEKGYKGALGFSLSHRFLVLLIGLGIFASNFFFFARVPGEFASESDTSKFNIFVETAPGSNIYYTIEKIKEVENILRKHKEIKNFSVSIGDRNEPVQKATMYINLVAIKDRNIRQVDFISKLQLDLNKITGAVVFASSPSIGGGAYPLEFYVTGTNLQELYKYNLQLTEAFKNDSALGGVNAGMKFLPQLRFKTNKDKAALLNLSSKDIVDAIAVSVGGLSVAKYNNLVDLERYDIKLRGKETQFTWTDSINNIYLRAGEGLVRLDSVVSAEEYLGFLSVDRYGTLFSANFKIKPSAALSDAIIAVNKIANKILPPGYKIEYSGSSKEFQKTVKNVAVVFGLALLVLYMVLASQFNSFIQPLVLMTAVPLAVVGGVCALYITNFTLNMFSMIGLILLVGLVAKNSILLIDFTNELRLKEGKSINEALMQACPIRLRPILMTSLTVILTMIPAALSKAEGSEDNASLAIVILGGMISSTLLTLFIVPTSYSVVEHVLQKKKNKLKKDFKDA